MTNCVFYILMFSFFLNFTLGSINFSAVNRIFLGMYRSIFECSAQTIDDHAQSVDPFYKKDTLERKLNEYFDENLKQYTTSYELRVYYFNDDITKTVCTSNYCTNVEVSLKCNINLFFIYEKSQDFFLVVTDL